MNNILKIALLSILFLVGIEAMGQGAKFGHLNSSELLQLMPETKSAEASMETYAKQLEADFQQKTESYQAKFQDFLTKRDNGTMTPQQEQTLMAELQQLEQELGQIQMSSQEKLAQKQEELLKPILQKAKDAIDAVAVDGGFAYVFDTSPGGMLLFAETSENVIEQVKQKLGL